MKKPDKSNSLKVKVYSTTTCEYCKSLRYFLNKKHINYEEAIVDLDHDALREMIEESEGFTSVPFTVIEKEGCAKIKIKGFDVSQFKAALSIH